MFEGRNVEMDDSNMQDGMRIAYTPYPPNQLCSKEVANSDVAAAGPTARTTEATTWATPFTAPRERLLGAEDVTYMKTAPASSLG